MRKPAIAGGVFFANSWLELRDDFRYNSCAHSLAAFADSKAHLLFHGDRADELHLEGHGVARHDHFHAFFERYFAGYVRGADVELRLVAGEKRRVAATFLLSQNVDLRLKFRVRLY